MMDPPAPFIFAEGLRSGLVAVVFLLLLAFQIWMLIDAVRREEYIWAAFILIFLLMGGTGLSALLYYFLVYRQYATSSSGGARREWPGRADRRRMQELQGLIHHLDKAHHHMELGDIHRRRHRAAEAEKCYRAALAREPEDPDILARLGVLLAEENRHAEARPLLEKVCAENPDHDYGNTLMGLADTLEALGDSHAAVSAWKQVLDHHVYARARVRLAALLLQHGDTQTARTLLQQTVDDDAHTPAFARGKERAWVRQARQMLRRVR